MEPIYVWLMTLILFVVVEIATMGLTTIWFAGGALVALLLSVFQTSFYVQLGAFLAVSIVLLVVTRPLALKYFNQKVEKTNAEGLIGKQAIVVSQIHNLKEEGQVMIGGMEWSARAYEENRIIPSGSVVEVKEIRGVKLIVSEVEKE